jgi:ferrochelatase
LSAEAGGRAAVLLLAYGAPQRLEDVEPYLLDVRGGRATPPELVEEVRRRYARLGGTSPLLERTREQAAALEGRLGDGTRVFAGMRHWHPYIRDVLAEIRAAGFGRVIAVPLAPHYSGLSIGAYERAVEDGRGSLAVAMVLEWYQHSAFLDAVAQRVRAALERCRPAPPDRIPLVFTAHSLPERILADGDPYVAQLEASMDGVLARLGRDRSRAHLAFQSAGRTAERWLSPEAAWVVEELADTGERTVVVCPIGFVSDHLEVLYDVDVELQGLARRRGLHLERTESLNGDPLLIDALADLVRTAARQQGWQV